MKTVIERTAITLSLSKPFTLQIKGGVDLRFAEIILRYPKIKVPVTIKVKFGDEIGRHAGQTVSLPMSGSIKFFIPSNEILSETHFNFIELVSSVDISLELSIKQGDASFH